MENEFKIGQNVYYKTIFGKYKTVILIAQKKVRVFDREGIPLCKMEYMIKFPNGKMKQVYREQIF